MDAAADAGGRIVRELLLGRRRSRVPWVYVVYHRHAGHPRVPACAAVSS